MDKLFDEIRKDREGVVNSSVYPGIKKLVSQIYPDKAHFIYELLQNAEDTRASEVNFTVMEDKLIFRHNGKKQFDIADINAITNIGDSTKKDNYVQAGKFGIGFKSVYAFTDTPSIYCDSICFKIENLLLPTRIEDLKDRNKGWTVFHFPYDSPKINAAEARVKIIEGLKEIEETTPLFLNNINKISYSLDNNEIYEISKSSEYLNSSSKDGIIVTSVASKSGKTVNEMHWLKFTEESKLNEKRISYDVAFPVIKKKTGDYQITSGSDKVCITFLAKNEKSNLKFFINAPFGCTPARDTVNKTDNDNDILIDKIAELVNKSLFIIKDNGMLDDNFLEVLPLVEDDIPAFYSPIVDVIDNAFKKNALLPSMSGNNIYIVNGMMTSRNVADVILKISDIRALYKNDKLDFVQNRASNTRAYKFLKKLKIEELTSENLLYKMVRKSEADFANWICRFDSNDRLSNLYGYLYKGIIEIKQEEEKNRVFALFSSNFYALNETTIAKHEKAKQYQRALNTLTEIYELKIVKDNKGDFCKASQAKIPESNVWVPDKYNVVEPELLRSNSSRNFLQEIGVKVFSEREYRQYQKNEEKSESIRKLKSLSSKSDAVEIAKLVMFLTESYTRQELNTNEDFFDLKFVKVQTDSRDCFVCIRDCFLDDPYVPANGFSAVKHIHYKYKLSSIYYERMNKEELYKWIKFLKENGAYYAMTVKVIKEGTGYATGHKIDYDIQFLTRYLREKNIIINKNLWDMLTSYSGWKSEYGYYRCQVNRNHKEIVNDSSLLSALKKNEWILDKSGNFQKPSMISKNNIAEEWVLKYDNGFLNALELGCELKRIEEQKRMQEKSAGEAAKSLGFESASDAAKAKEALEILNELIAQGIDPKKLAEDTKKSKAVKNLPSTVDDLIESANKKRINENHDYDDDEEISPVKNPSRRASKISQAIAEEDDSTKTRSTSEKSSKNPMEKEYVGQEYKGICQICSKKIVKKNNERYFEAVNLFDTGKIHSKYNAGNSTGWNTLCLCPNCCAEYKYGDVSLPDFEKNVMDTVIDRDSDEHIKFTIIMQSERRQIRYTPRHLFSLQTALKHFREQEQKKTEAKVESKSKKNDYNFDDKGIYIVLYGNVCPECGEKVNNLSFVETRSIIGVIKYEYGYKCKCGCEFLTNDQAKNLKDKIFIKKIVGEEINNSVTFKSDSRNSNISKCPKCGLMKEIFADKDICWDCYKHEKQSEFD